MCWSPHARGPFCSSRGQFDPQDLASEHALRRKVILQNNFENSKSTRTQLQNSLEKVVKMRKLVMLWPNVGRGGSLAISMVDICSISDIRASNASSYRFIQNSLHFLESHIVPEQYSIQKKYPKHSVSRKSHLTYTNVRNTFQTNQNLGAL